MIASCALNDARQAQWLAVVLRFTTHPNAVLPHVTLIDEQHAQIRRPQHRHRPSQPHVQRRTLRHDASQQRAQQPPRPRMPSAE